jgi:uncharacterized iron-regulated membrane protein
MKRLPRVLHRVHRWTGIVLGLLILLWLISGLVMVFMPRPALSLAERLSGLPPLGAGSVRISPLEAWKSLGLGDWPKSARLNASGERPVYHFEDSESHRFSVHADDGSVLDPPDSPDEAVLRRIVAPYAAGAAIVSIVSVERDQWSVVAYFDSLLPLVRVELSDGRHYYVSTRTGEAVLDTARAERGWNWLGSFTHWLYFTKLRRDFGLWRAMILWLAFAAIVVSSSGVYLGVERLRISQPYPGGRFSPYREKWKRYHHLSGLAGGVFLFAWLFSGWLSLSPMGWAKSARTTEEERLGLAGGPLDAEVLSKMPRLDGKTREVRWTRFDSRAAALLFDGEIPIRWGFSTDESRIEAPLTLEEIAARGKNLKPRSRLVAADWLTAQDSYYYPRGGRRLPLPVARLRFDDAFDTAYYIDAVTGEIAAKIDRGARVQRWLYRGLHRLDFPPFDRHETARRILVIVASLTCAFLTLSGCVLGVKRLQEIEDRGQRGRPLFRNQ